MRRATGLLLWVIALTAAGDAAALERIVYDGSSAFYDRILVVDDNGLRSLRFGDLAADSQSLVRPGHPEQLPMPYLRAAAVALTVPENLRRVLIVGLGGGAFANYIRARLPDVTIDAVEIDPVVAQLASDYFAVSENDRLSVHVMDAVDFVKEHHPPYDLIFLDAYDADDLPEALLYSTFLNAVREQLASGGIVVANVAISGTRKARGVIRTLANPYPYCLQLRSPPRFNDILLLSPTRLPSPSDLIASARAFDADSVVAVGLEHYAETAKTCFGPGR